MGDVIDGRGGAEEQCITPSCRFVEDFRLGLFGFLLSDLGGGSSVLFFRFLLSMFSLVSARTKVCYCMLSRYVMKLGILGLWPCDCMTCAIL